MLTGTKTKFELLYFEDCPSWKNALEILNNILSGFGLSPKITLIQVETQDQAEKYKFVGSPTIRANGVDLFPIEHNQYALGCRLYQTPEGFKGWPTEEMLKGRIETILRSKQIQPQE